MAGQCREGGSERSSRSHSEGVSGIVADHTVVLLPVGEGITSVRRGSEGDFVLVTAANHVDGAQIGHLIISKHAKGKLRADSQGSIDIDSG